MNSRLKITANMVTMARIALLPIPCSFLIYGGTLGMWSAFILYTLLGATDFIDGAMARREGPTKLGGLLDPVADKIFVASICLGLVAIKMMPPWALMAILSREFFITALRTSVALRNETFKTSKLAKIKTFIQMGGFGTIFMSIALTRMQAVWVGITLFSSISLFAIWYFAKNKKRPPFWAIPLCLSFLYWTLLSAFTLPSTSVFWQYVVIVALTWISCLDYVVSSYKMFLRTGISMLDVIRILWSFSHSLLAAPLVYFYPHLVLPLLLSISFELALGGVDMVVAAEKNYAGILPFFVTSLVAILSSCVVFATYLGVLTFPVYVPAALLAVTSIGAFSFTFYRWRLLFLKAFASN